MIGENVSILTQALTELAQFSVPHVGSFIRQVQQARIDPQKNLVFPPYETVLFVPYTGQYTYEFITFLQQKKQLTAPDANKLADELGLEVLQYLEHFKELELPEYGILKKGENNLITFERYENWKWSEVPLTDHVPPPRSVKPEDKPIIHEVPFEATAKPETASATLPQGREVPNRKEQVAKNKAVRNTVTIGVGVVIAVTTIALFFFRREINDALGIENKPKAKIITEHTEDHILLEALEGDSMIDVVPVSRDSVEAKVKEIEQDNFKNPIIFHIIVGVAENKTEAEKFRAEWTKKGFEVELVPAEKGGRIRISIFRSDHLNTTDKKLSELKLHSKIPYDTWVLKVKNQAYRQK